MLRSFPGGLFAEQFGDSPAEVLALHGWGRSRLDFEAVFAGDPTSPLRGLAVDLPGFGASPPPPVAWATEDYAACCEVLFDATVERCVLVGHSFGALVALRLAQRHPARVQRLILTGAPLSRPVGARAEPALAYRLVRTFARWRVVSPARLERARQRYGSSDYAHAQGVMREVLVRRLGEEFESALCGLKVPLTLVWGELDRTTPLSIAERARTLVPGATLEVVPGVGHLLPTESPASLRAVIQASCV